MRTGLTNLIAASFFIAAFGNASAMDTPEGSNPYFSIGGPPAGVGNYTLAAPRRTTPMPSTHKSVGPQATPENSRVDRLYPGTGRYEGPSNTPCIGTTSGLGTIPGHKC